MSSPNILFLMTDQMQDRVLEPTSSCQTPNLDRLATAGCDTGSLGKWHVGRSNNLSP